MVVRMELSRILIRELTEMQVIELAEVLEGDDGEPSAIDDPRPRRTFPIVIGLPEAQAIERRLKGISIKRPQTHDLLANVVRELGANLESITITKLEEHTFFATLDVRRSDGELINIDSRPSDAIALGVAEQVPIYVDQSVLEQAAGDEA